MGIACGVIEEFMAVIRAERNFPVILTDPAPARLFLKQHGRKRDHIGIAGKMRRLLEGTVGILAHIAQMGEPGP